MRNWILVLVTVFATVSPIVVAAQGGPAGVQTDVVTTSEMTETVTVFGQIVAVRESAVATRVAGVLNEVPIQVGSSVAAGDVLARMDTVRLEIEVASAQAALAIATAGLEVSQAQADRADKAFQRAQELTANASISGAQFDDRASALAEALGGMQEARARIVAAENAIDLARYNLNNATVYAPFDGIVLEVSTQMGQFAAAGSQVATLLDTKSMEVQANVPSRFIAALEPGRIVIGKNDAGRELSLTLRAVLPTEFSETRTRPVRFALTALDSSFAIGQPVTLDVPIGVARAVIMVPKDALVQARSGWTAFVNEDGKAAPRTVTIGAALGDQFEVLSGLVPGDEVVVRGNERLRPGQDIAPQGQGDPAGRPSGAAQAGGDAPAEEG